ncbi:MAG TPA: septum formation initiator family protein [Thermoleophilaceae bacterium]
MAQATVARSRAAAARRRRPAPPGSRRTGGSGIRWDRVGRMSLLAVLGVILLLYISPLHRYFSQSQTAGRQREELRSLEQENARLKQGIADLRSPQSLERRARELGMVKQGERAYVIENIPGR